MALSMFKKKQFVGLDIGASTIAAVQAEKSGDVWKVTRWASAKTPPDAVHDGEIKEVDAVADVIRQVLQDGGISANTAVIGAAGGGVVVRTVHIPKMAEATLRKSIRFEAGRYVPSSVEDSFIEFEILGDADEGNMEVLIAAAPKAAVESRIEVCKRAGLGVEAVDIEAFAMHRSLVEMNSDEDLKAETLALIDIGSSSTVVSVVSDGSFVMTRSIPQAGEAMTEALKAYFKLDDEKAEDGKRQLDLASLLEEDDVVENPPLRVLQPHVDELIREVRRSLNYYQSQQSEKGESSSVTRIVLSGGGANLSGLAPYFEHKLGLPVVTLGVFDNPRVLAQGDDAGHGRDLSVASGLAMRAGAAA